MGSFNAFGSSIVTPMQHHCHYGTWASTPGSQTYDNKCMTYVPQQQEGMLMNSDYKFSDGYSMNYDLYKQGPMCPTKTTVELELDQGYANGRGEYSHAAGMQSPCANFYPAEGAYQTPHSQGCMYQPPFGYFPVIGTEAVPELVLNQNRHLPLTPGFFAENSVFKRIPLHAGRAVFRRRKQGDCVNEWSNAFHNDEVDPCEPPMCCTN